MRRLLAFTLIELLIVVAIIGILAAIAVPNFLHARIRAKVAATYANLRATQSGINMYILDHGRPFYRAVTDNPYRSAPPGQPQPDPDLQAIGRRYSACSCYQYHFLTSPVAYLSSYDPCLDPVARHDWLRDLPVPDRRFCFHYQQSYAHSTSLFFLQSNNRRFTLAQNFKYILISSGPSGISATDMGIYTYGMMREEMILNDLYAPTNGIMSIGGIVASDSGVFGY